MESLSYVFGALGAVLLLVAVVGGGFEFLGWRMPSVGHGARVLAFTIGGAAVVAAIGLFAAEHMLLPSQQTRSASASGSSESPDAPDPPEASPSTARESPTPPESSAAPETSPPPSPTAEPRATDVGQLAPAVGYVVNGGYGAFVYYLPSTTSVVVGQLPEGFAVDILCTVRGEPVANVPTGYTTDLWNYITDGGYVPDAWLNTGTNEPTMPAC